jgi:two-component system cell cycle sensor histidine kinase/response regulator CckA
MALLPADAPTARPPSEQHLGSQESALRVSWAHRFFQLSADLLLVIDPEGRILQASPSWSQVLGCPPESLEAQPYARFVHPEDLAAVEHQLRSLTGPEHRTSFTCRWLCQDGTSPWLSWSVSASPSDGMRYCAARPLALPPRAPAPSAPLPPTGNGETLWIEGDQPWRMSDDLALGLYLMDARSGRVLYANRQFFQLWNIAELEEPFRRGESIHSRVIQQCLPIVAEAEAFLRLYSTPGEGTSLQGSQDEVVLTDGRTLQRSSTAIRDAQGTELCWLHVFKDITGLKRTEEALRRSEMSFRKLIETAPEAICVHRDRRFVYVNAAMLAGLRYERASDLIGRPVFDVIHPDDHQMIRERVAKILATGKPVPPQELRFVRSDGSVYDIETVALAVEFDGLPSVLVMVRDITERKQMQAQLLQADRMVVMGTLAAGVGHEINNPLTYVLSNLSLAGEEVEQFGRELEQDTAALADAQHWSSRVRELREMLAEAHSGAERVRIIVRDLKIFSRQGEEQRAAVDVKEVLDFSIKMSFNEVRSRARLLKQYDAVPAVYADGARLGQVFLNLLVNAAQAIPEGNAQGNTITVQVRREAPGQVAVEVSDTGTGIEAEALPRIFDPFFTTKPVGAGTGLGLSICHGIIKSLGGEISVRSELGRGSTFTVLLPAATSLSPSDETAETPVESGKGHVLVIDDEPGVGRALARMIGAKHAVTVVESGQAGLERLLSGQPFDAVFCDLMMPDLSGMDLYERMRELKPGLAARFVFMTGGAFTPRARQFLETVPNGWLEKPFDAQQLLRLLGQVLREHRASPEPVSPNR